MPYELFLATRYLRAHRKHRLARATVLVAVLGITVGVAALIVAMALANGFRDEMRDKILQGTAHLTVMRTDGKPMNDYRELATRVSKLAGIANATGTSYDGAVVVGPKGSAYAVLRGIDGESEQAKQEVNRSLIEGSAGPIFAAETEVNDPAKVVIGAELAARTGLQVGDVAEIISANAGIASFGPSKRPVRVTGIFRCGLFEYDSTWVYLALEVAAEFTGSKHAASVISVQVSDIYSVKQDAAEVRATLGSSYTTVDWQEANGPLFTALALERRMGLFIVALIILMAALNITTTLILVVIERRRHIAILNAMGATSRSIMSVFMIEGAIIGALGSALGVILGGLACLVGNHYKLVSLPADVYSISYVPFNAQFRDVLLAALVAFALSLIATVYPARAAARVRAAEMLRDAG
jgi:lipoprotein-releasing system permease protein